MQIIRGIDQLNASHRPSVVSIGSYDGVHLGHQQVIRTLIEKAEQLGAPPTIVTFEPLAKEFFSPASALRINSFAQRVKQLAKVGVERVLCVEFNAEFAAYEPDKFVRDVLVNGLGARFLCVGDDFRFGKDRAGDYDFLQAAGQEHGFSVAAHETYTLDAERVSSGRVRTALQANDFELVAKLLGRPYSIDGVVSQGRRLGRTLNFPTANIVLDDVRYALSGVYVVQVALENQQYKFGVANIGKRPTVDGEENRLEVHLFDFAEDLYGQTISVRFIDKLRDEQKFSSVEELKQQIQADVRLAREILEIT